MNLKKVSVINFLYYIAFFLWCVAFYCSKVQFLENYLVPMKLISIVIFMFIFILQFRYYDKKNIFLLFIFIILNIIVLILSQNSSLFFLFFMLLASRSVEVDDFIKKDIIIKIFIVLFLFIMSNLGLTSEHILYRNGVQRYSFGFAHPNALGQVLSSIVIEYIYLKKKRSSIFEIILYVATILFISYFPNSRAPIIVLFIFMIYKLFYKFINSILNNKIIKKIIENIWVVLTLVSMLLGLMFIYKLDIGYTFDQLLNTRVKWIAYFLENYKINLFGNKLLLVSTEVAESTNVKALILDNAYVRFILQYGLILFLIFSLMIKKMLDNEYENKNLNFIFIFTIILLKGIAEHSIYLITGNVFLIYLKKIIYVEKMEDNNDFKN